MIDTYTWTLNGFNLDGLIAGLATWIIIWATRLACIKGEYYFKRRFRFVFLFLGIAGILAGIFIHNLVLSAILCIFGFANLWGIHEVIEQQERVNKGWYPRKPDN